MTAKKANYNRNYHEDETQTRSFEKGLFFRMLGYLKPLKFRVFLAVTLLIASKLCVLGVPLVISSMLKMVGNNNSSIMDLWKEIVVLIALVGAGFGLGYAQGVLTGAIGLRVTYRMRDQVFRRILSLPTAYFDRTPVGRLVTRTINDIDILYEMFGGGMVSLLGEFFILLGVVVLMFVVNVHMAILAIAVLPLLVLNALSFRRRAREGFRKVRTVLAALNSAASERLGGMSTIQSFNRESRSFHEFKEINEDHTTANIVHIKAHASFLAGVEVFQQGLLIVFLTEPFFFGNSSWNTKDFIVFSMLVMMFFRPLRQLVERYNVLQSALASAERIFQVLDTEPETKVENPLPFSGKVESLEFKNVYFAYEKEHWILKDVSFKLNGGQSLAIVGSTGSGKTTIISLLTRLYDIQKGEILLNGINITHIEPADLRRTMGVVLQDAFIFSGSIGRNIALKSSMGNDKIKNAAEFVNANHFINKLAGGYDEIMLERGAGLSVGERQLLGFARVLAHEPALLVMDEATSHIDTATEKLIQQALEKLLVSRTAIVIAHRLSTIKNCSSILFLKHGSVVEFGSHQELMKKEDGLYRKLYSMQFNDRL